jgi:cysteine desulfurase / selenocysteine lyase
MSKRGKIGFCTHSDKYGICQLDYPMRSIIYVNNAATTWPKPRPVVDAVCKSLLRPYREHGRGTGDAADYPAACRETLAGFFRAQRPEHIQFTANATESLNMLIHGFVKHNRGRFHAVTSELEHNAVLRPLNTLRRGRKIALTIVPFDSDGYVSLESVKEAVREDTRLVVLSHGSNVLGSVQDIGRIGRYLRGRGVYFIVDAAQTAGVAGIDLARLDADAVAFTGHKYLFGFQGIGGFHIKDPGMVDAYKQGGTGSQSQNPYQPERMPLKYEAGTLNYPGIVSLQAGVKFVEKSGLGRIGRKTKAMTRCLVDELAGEENIAVHNAKPDLPVVSFNIDGLDSTDAGEILAREHGIVTRAGLHCAPLVHDRIDDGRGSVRLSLSHLNTMDECGKVADAIVRLAGSVRRGRAGR